jgi:hypothetical protein
MTTSPRVKWTYDELAGPMAQDILDYIKTGNDRRDFYFAIPCDDFPVEKRVAKWEQADKQRAALMRTQLAEVGGRFEKLRPKIAEAKAKLAEAKPAQTYRRVTKTEASFILPVTQPKVESAKNDNPTRRAVATKIVEAHRDDFSKRKPSGRAESAC